MQETSQEVKHLLLRTHYQLQSAISPRTTHVDLPSSLQSNNKEQVDNNKYRADAPMRAEQTQVQ